MISRCVFTFGLLVLCVCMINKSWCQDVDNNGTDTPEDSTGKENGTAYSESTASSESSTPDIQSTSLSTATESNATKPTILTTESNKTSTVSDKLKKGMPVWVYVVIFGGIAILILLTIVCCVICSHRNNRTNEREKQKRMDTEGGPRPDENRWVEEPPMVDVEYLHDKQLSPKQTGADHSPQHASLQSSPPSHLQQKKDPKALFMTSPPPQQKSTVEEKSAKENMMPAKGVSKSTRVEPKSAVPTPSPKFANEVHKSVRDTPKTGIRRPKAAREVPKGFVAVRTFAHSPKVVHGKLPLKRPPPLKSAGETSSSSGSRSSSSSSSSGSTTSTSSVSSRPSPSSGKSSPSASPSAAKGKLSSLRSKKVGKSMLGSKSATSSSGIKRGPLYIAKLSPKQSSSAIAPPFKSA